MYISASSSSRPISTTTNTNARILSSAFATSSRSSSSGRRSFSGNKNVPKKPNFGDDPRGSKSANHGQRCFLTRASASSSFSDSMMTPIQLQDMARKQFENRERSRAQMVSHSSSSFSFLLCLTERVFGKIV
jgi:hypothetical protein